MGLRQIVEESLAGDGEFVSKAALRILLAQMAGVIDALGQPNGGATLDEAGHLPVDQLPPGIGSGGGDGGADVDLDFGCASSVPVLAPVYVSGANFVALADAADVAKGPVRGLVVSKPTPTTCTVRVEKELGGFSGLVPGETYFLASGGGLTRTPQSDLGTLFVQPLGWARNPTTLVIEIEDRTVL